MFLVKRSFVAFLFLSGWLVAGVLLFRYERESDREDEIRQCQIDMAQLSLILWKYAQNNGGQLPPQLNKGLPGYLGSEGWLSYAFDFVTPSADLFTLPPYTVVLRRALIRTAGSEIVMLASGAVFVRQSKSPNHALQLSPLGIR